MPSAQKDAVDEENEDHYVDDLGDLADLVLEREL